MSEFYRFGPPGSDFVAHINTGRKSSGAKCIMDRFPEDSSQWGPVCGRMSVALCDAPGCDKPMCTLHRTRHISRPNTDFCSEHVYLSGASGWLAAPHGEKK